MENSLKNIASLLEGADRGELELLLAAVEKRLCAGAGSEAGVLAASEGVSRALDAGQLDALTTAVAVWRAGAESPGQRRSRARIRLAYLLFRYGGLRLGEVLALDDSLAFDFAKNQVAVPGPAARLVQIPPPVMREITELLDEPMFFGLRGQVLRVDPGYLRRKLYGLADLAGLPRELVNPRVLRHSRAIELLNGGVPLKAVQFFLGRSGRAGGDGFGVLSPRAGEKIVQDYLTREVKMKTSARNVFMGMVSRLAHDGLLAEVELTTLSGLKIVAAITAASYENLGLAEGSVVTASVKAPWVVLAEAPAPGQKRGNISARNQFSGKVEAVKLGKLVAEVQVELYEGSKVCALITRDSAHRMGLAQGLEVLALFKAFSVILQTAPN